jgi:BirA family biotin operon repressor/biotin-[acetyl-CoA-carboxylase] ligase
MQIYTDSPEYAQQILTTAGSFIPFDNSLTSDVPRQIADQLYPNKIFFIGFSPLHLKFDHFFISTDVHFSQYDMLLNYAKRNALKRENILCFAGSGEHFHGFRQRKWAAVPGNIHLSVLLNPGKRIEHAETAFLILAANAVTQTINELENINQKAMIHWVNDIILDAYKVGGVLAQTQILGNNIEKVVLGIGLNVNETPDIKEDQFVKRATHINEYVKGKHYPISHLLVSLIQKLESNYKAILQNNYHDLLRFYIDHSFLVGKTVEIYSDPREGEVTKITEGVVSGITENLELIINGQQDFIRKGRVKLLNYT